MFVRKVKEKYKIEAIIPKEDFKKGGKYHETFYGNFDKDKYKSVAPKLQQLFRTLGGGKLKHTVIVDYAGKPSTLKDIDIKMIEALQKLGYEVNDEMYKTGHVLKNNKEVPILEILKTKATKVRGYDKRNRGY